MSTAVGTIRKIQQVQLIKKKFYKIKRLIFSHLSKSIPYFILDRQPCRPSSGCGSECNARFEPRTRVSESSTFGTAPVPTDFFPGAGSILIDIHSRHDLTQL